MRRRARLRYAPEVMLAFPRPQARGSVARASAAPLGCLERAPSRGEPTQRVIRPTPGAQPAEGEGAAGLSSIQSLTKQRIERVVGPTFFRSGARGLHMPTTLTPQPEEHE